MSEQTALITNDIVPVLIDIVAKVAEENILNDPLVEKQTLAEIIKKFPVYHGGGAADKAYDIERSIESLDVLLKELKSESISKGRSPGFDTIGSNHFWVLKSQYSTSYEVLPSVNYGTSLPLPDADVALECLSKVRNAWEERLKWVNAFNKNEFCSCIRLWEHHNGNILSILANQ